jgi:hypothetical protein
VVPDLTLEHPDLDMLDMQLRLVVAVNPSLSSMWQQAPMIPSGYSSGEFEFDGAYLEP